MLLSPFACFDCTCIDSKGERAVNLPLNNLVSEAEGKPTSSVWAYFFFKHGAMEAACLDLAAVICGCCGRTSASYEKAGEDLSLVCGLAWDEPPAAGRVESICDEWAGQRMGTLVVGYKRSVSTMKMDSSDLWPHRNWPETFLTNPAWFQDVALFANLEQEIMTQVFFLKDFFLFSLPYTFVCLQVMKTYHMYHSESISAEGKLKEAEKQEEKQIGRGDPVFSIRMEDKYQRRSSVKKIEKMKEKVKQQGLTIFNNFNPICDDCV